MHILWSGVYGNFDLPMTNSVGEFLMDISSYSITIIIFVESEITINGKGSCFMQVHEPRGWFIVRNVSLYRIKAKFTSFPL